MDYFSGTDIRDKRPTLILHVLIDNFTNTVQKETCYSFELLQHSYYLNFSIKRKDTLESLILYQI